MVQSIAKLQRDLENTIRDLDSAKSSIAEKDRIIKQRDALLESHALELRKMGELLDKERQAHRNVKHQFETFQKTHQHVTRTVSSQDQRIMELEQAKAQDKKRLSQLENSFKEQLTERNNLLLLLWTRLSALCGSDWAHDNSLINGRALPSLEAVATMLPGFSKNLLAAVKMIESIIGGFQTKVKAIEKELWKEYQTLENHLDQRTKKLDRLEAIVRNGIVTGQINPHSHTLSETQARLARLEDAYRQLKVENHTLRAAAEARRAAYAAASAERNGNLDSAGESPSPSVPMGPKAKASVSKIPKSGSRLSLARSSAPSVVATPQRSSSYGQHYFSQHHPSKPNLVMSPAGGEDMGLARSRGGSPGAPNTPGSGGGGGGGGDDDDTLTLRTPTQASHSQQNRGRSQERSGSSGGNNGNNHQSSSTSSTTAVATQSSSTPSVNTTSSPGGGGSGGGGGGILEPKFMLRLRDLENKLKAEREGRRLDREEAMKRINASEHEAAVLRENLEREKRRAAGR